MAVRVATDEIDFTMPTRTVTSCACAAAAPAATMREASRVRLRMAMIGSLPAVCLWGFGEIAPFSIALERCLRTQLLECAHDLAAVAAARRAHQLLEGFGAMRQRRRKR